MVVNRTNTLSDTVTRQLLHEIREGLYAGRKNLPPEKEIAERMGVSRPVIRDALSRLEREGYVSRKQGVGTLINHHILELTSRMDQEKDFLDAIIDAGYEPRTLYVRTSETGADTFLADKLDLEEGAPLLLVERLIAADRVPVVLCRDYFSKALLEGADYEEEDLTIPVYHFLREVCGKDVQMDVAEVDAAAADASVAADMRIEEGTPLLVIDEVGYDVLGRPLTYSKEYIAGDKLRHTVLQKRL